MEFQEDRVYTIGGHRAVYWERAEICGIGGASMGLFHRFAYRKRGHPAVLDLPAKVGDSRSREQLKHLKIPGVWTDFLDYSGVRQEIEQDLEVMLRRHRL
jgi:hypothetical protein